MASLTIRSLDDSLKERLRAMAAMNERSMAAEAREILRAALNAEPAGTVHSARAIPESDAP